MASDMRIGAWAHIWTVLRLAVAGAIAAAIVAQALVTIGGAEQQGRHILTVTVNFFSFFTILSNVATVAVLIWTVLWFWTRGGRRAHEPAALAFALASVTTYMIVTGIVYNVLLRNIELEPGATVGWSNEVLHLAAPAFLLLDLFLGARRRALPWGAIGGILVFPAVWILYTLARGPLITNPRTGDAWWYPYPFLDPHNFRADYLGVATYVVGIAAAIAAIAAGVVWVGRWRGRDAAPAAHEPETRPEHELAAIPAVAFAASTVPATLGATPPPPLPPLPEAASAPVAEPEPEPEPAATEPAEIPESGSDAGATAEDPDHESG